jgi:F0F1-type ATP synthase delta subunit
MLGGGQIPVITSSVDAELMGGLTVSIGDQYSDMKERFYI